MGPQGAIISILITTWKDASMCSKEFDKTQHAKATCYPSKTAHVQDKWSLNFVETLHTKQSYDNQEYTPVKVKLLGGIINYSLFIELHY